MIQTVRKILCDACGYRDSEEKFPDIWNSPEKYDEVMKRYGNGENLTLGVGIVCPECGNFSEFDFSPGEGPLVSKPPLWHYSTFIMEKGC